MTSYQEWLKKLDQEVKNLVKISYLLLPTQPIEDWYKQKVSPKTAAKRIVKAIYE